MVKNELYHHGILGQKWGKRNGPPYPLDASDHSASEKKAGWKKSLDKGQNNDDIVIKKGDEIHRIVPKAWVNNEKKYSGYAYASYKKEDVERYKHFARLFGDGNNYVDMTFRAKDAVVSPSRKKRIDEFVKLIDSNPEARKALLRATRNPLIFMPKNRLDKLDDPKQAEKAYEKFAFLLVSKKELRDPYFKQLEKAGYSMIIDDADVRGGVSKTPIIVFDRTKSMDLKSVKTIGRKDTD